MYVQSVEIGKGNKYREKGSRKFAVEKAWVGNFKGIISVKLCLFPDSLG